MNSIILNEENEILLQCVHESMVRNKMHVLCIMHSAIVGCLVAWLYAMNS